MARLRSNPSQSPVRPDDYQHGAALRYPSGSDPGKGTSTTSTRSWTILHSRPGIDLSRTCPSHREMNGCNGEDVSMGMYNTSIVNPFERRCLESVSMQPPFRGRHQKRRRRRRLCNTSCLGFCPDFALVLCGAECCINPFMECQTTASASVSAAIHRY